MANYIARFEVVVAVDDDDTPDSEELTERVTDAAMEYFATTRGVEPVTVERLNEED